MSGVSKSAECYREASWLYRHFSNIRIAIISIFTPIILSSQVYAIRTKSEVGLYTLAFYILIVVLLFFVMTICSLHFGAKLKFTVRYLTQYENEDKPIKIYDKLMKYDVLNSHNSPDLFDRILLIIGTIELIGWVITLFS